MESTQDSLLYDYLLQQEYERARNMVAEKSLGTSDSLYYLVSIENARIIDYESFIPESTFFHGLCKKARTHLAHIPDPTQDERFYKASILSMQGLHYLKQGRSLRGLQASRRGINLMRELEKEGFTPHPLVEARALYEYYSATSLRWVPFTGNPKVPLETLHSLGRSSSIHHLFTLQNLFWIYYDRQEYTTAYTLIQRALETYPHNTLMLRAAANAAYHMGNYTVALEKGYRLITKATHREPRNLADILSAAVIISRSYMAQENTTQAAETIRQALSHSPSEYEARIEWVQKHRETLRNLRENL